MFTNEKSGTAGQWTRRSQSDQSMTLFGVKITASFEGQCVLTSLCNVRECQLILLIFVSVSMFGGSCKPCVFCEQYCNRAHNGVTTPRDTHLRDFWRHGRWRPAQDGSRFISGQGTRHSRGVRLSTKDFCCRCFSRVGRASWRRAHVVLWRCLSIRLWPFEF